jgi:hypothetical protein
LIYSVLTPANFIIITLAVHELSLSDLDPLFSALLP